MSNSLTNINPNNSNMTSTPSPYASSSASSSTLPSFLTSSLSLPPSTSPSGLFLCGLSLGLVGSLALTQSLSLYRRYRDRAARTRTRRRVGESDEREERDGNKSGGANEKDRASRSHCPNSHHHNRQSSLSQSQSHSCSHHPHHSHTHGHHARKLSRSHSGMRFEGSVSRLGSDASYLEENEYEGNHHILQEDDDGMGLGITSAQLHSLMDEENEPSIYICPHCSNYINSVDLILPSSLEGEGDLVDEADSERAHTQRVLSASEQLNIQLALKESLLQIFQSVDEDHDGIITREEMGAFLKKLGLTGDREAAFLNIVGDDTVQNSANNDSLSNSTTTTATTSTAKSSSSVVGINFRQFLDRFQDTFELMDNFELAAAAEAEENQQIPTNEKSTNSSENTDLSSSQSTDTSANANTTTDVEPSSSSTSSSAQLFTPPRPNSTSSRLTVNTSTPGVPQFNRSLTAQHVFSPSSGGGQSSSSSSSSASIRVFLGGACGDTTWRKQEAIPQFQAAGITYYDPQVKEWSQKLVALEGLMKAWCKILFFVIGSKTRALASMIEVASLIASGRRVVLVIEPIESGVEIEGQVPSASEVKDLNRAREYLKDVAAHYSIPVHTTTDAGIKAIIASEEEERREARARLTALRDAMQQSSHRNSTSSSSALNTPSHASGVSTNNTAAAGMSGSARRHRGSILAQGSPVLGAVHPSPTVRRYSTMGPLTNISLHPPPMAALHHAHSYSHSMTPTQAHHAGLTSPSPPVSASAAVSHHPSFESQLTLSRAGSHSSKSPSIDSSTNSSTFSSVASTPTPTQANRS